MPAYAWSCLSCGRSNAAADERCSECACPAAPRSSQIEDARRRYTQRGGTLESDAWMATARELSAFEVWVKLVFLGLLGYRPRRRDEG